jgi:hypothetical protein
MADQLIDRAMMAQKWRIATALRRKGGKRPDLSD